MISYVTDIEGQWDKLVSFATDNPYVRLVDGELVLAEDVTFVFGGDAIDRGPAGRKIVRTFTAAKRRYGERVILLAGNRDINKLRLGFELATPPSRVPAELVTAADRLAWILPHTMNAPRAFEFRAAELAAEGRAHDPAAVAQSFLDDLAPGGELRTYLEAAQLAYRHGVTLFVHGGVSDTNLFTVPGQPRAPGIDGWIAALNQFYRDELARDRATALIAYQAPLPGTHANETSVVYARPTNDLGDPILPSAQTIATLRANGIERVVVGHTPSGDSPAILRADGFELVLADNSYGRIEHGSQLAIDDVTTHVHGTTQLDDGTIVTADVTSPRTEPGLLGTHDQTGALIKSRLTDGRYLLFRGLGDHHIAQTAKSSDE